MTFKCLGKKGSSGRGNRHQLGVSYQASLQKKGYLIDSLGKQYMEVLLLVLKADGGLFAAGFGIPQSRRRVFILASYHGDARDVLLSQVPESLHLLAASA